MRLARDAVQQAAAAAGRGLRLAWRGVGRYRRPLPQGPCLVVQLEPRLLQVLDHVLRELALGIVRCMLLQEATQQLPAPAQGEADREHEVIAEGPGMHAGGLCSCFVL